MGVRATFDAALGNARLPMQIDIGFSDIITPEAATIVYPAILGYPPPELFAYNRETAIAEKFEAMVKLGELNSRMKDFFDVWMLSRTGTFRGAELAQAVAQTFGRRGTPLVTNPVCVTDGFARNAAKTIQWQAFVRRGRFEDPIDGIAEVAESVANFLRPVSSALIAGQPWTSVWQARGPWAPGT